MADTAIPFVAPAGNVSNIIPFKQRGTNAEYAPGVAPFDSNNPAHIRAWNTLFALGWSEQRFSEKHVTSLECVK